jgi:outer membrane immunogenic protein
MTRQLSIVTLASVLSVLGTNAWADGMVQHAAPPPCCEAPFAGAYIGAALGYGQQRGEITNESVGAPTSGVTFKDNDGGVTVGGYVGYNWQRCCHPFVFGVETDFNYLNTSPTVFESETSTGPTETSSLESRMDWFGTLRARTGYVVHEDWLLYATGGLAYASIDHKFSDNCVECSNVPPLPSGTFEQSNKDTKVGWTVGGGAEFLHDSHWLLRAEALYVDLGSETHSYVIPVVGATVPSVTGVFKWDDQFWVARLGLAYKFGEPERCCATVPLK